MRITAITPMKNEGPYILEWLAYHRAIGINDFLIFTNDCTDGTDLILERLDEMGLVRHLPNPSMYQGSDRHHGNVIRYVGTFPRLRRSDWFINMDVDEFLFIRAGQGRIADLIAACPEGTQLISLCQHLFGCNGVRGFEDAPVIGQFTRAMSPRPEQDGRAPRRGIKTLVRGTAPVRNVGNHSPKIFPRRAPEVTWVNGDGVPLSDEIVKSAPKFLTAPDIGYGLGQVNHYAVRSMDSYLVQAERGDANFGDRSANLRYWQHSNANDVVDTGITAHLPGMLALRDQWLRDPELRALHEGAVAWHRDRIAALSAREDMALLRRQIDRAHARRWESAATAP